MTQREDKTSDSSDQNTEQKSTIASISMAAASINDRAADDDLLERVMNF